MSTTNLKSNAVAAGSRERAVASPARSAKGFLPELLALVVVVVWGSTFPLTKDAYEEIEPLAYGFARFTVIPLIALAVLFVHSRRNPEVNWWRIRRQDIPLFVFTGVCGYTIYQLGFMLGLAHTSPFSGALMIALQPIVTLGIVTLLGEKQPAMVWVGVLVALAGVAMFLSNNDGDSRMLGNLISFAGGAAFACYQVFNRRLIREYPPATFSAYSTLFGAIPLLLIATPTAIEQDWGQVSLYTWAILLYMSIFPVYLAYIAWGWAIGQRGVAIAGLTLLVPVVSGVMAMLFFTEEFGPLKVIGGALALAGMLVMQQANRRRQREARAG